MPCLGESRQTSETSGIFGEPLAELKKLVGTRRFFHQHAVEKMGRVDVAGTGVKRGFPCKVDRSAAGWRVSFEKRCQSRSAFSLLVNTYKTPARSSAPASPRPPS